MRAPDSRLASQQMRREFEKSAVKWLNGAREQCARRVSRHTHTHVNHFPPFELFSLPFTDSGERETLKGKERD